MPGHLGIAAALAVTGAVLGFAADRWWWTAVLLHAEPLLLIAVLFAVYLALASDRRARAFAIAGGGLFGFGFLRAPAAYGPAVPPSPEWARTVAWCAASLPPPVDDFRLLQWTLDPSVGRDDVRELVSLLAPGVTVLQGVADERLPRELAGEFGGEYLWVPRADGGLALVTTGVFHLCRDASSWGEAQEDPYGATLVFAGVTPETAFPLLVGRLPGPEHPVGWAGRSAAARDRLAAILGAVQAPTTIVAADASAPWTYRRLDGGMGALGLRAVPVPPNWPAHLGAGPGLPIHPYDRLWTGSAWTTTSSRRVQVDVGVRAPVLTELTPATRQAR